MASGRLGSALVGASRTLTVYDNTSGFSAAISFLARMKSTTSNGTISVILDNSSTAPEALSQISTTSFNKQVLKLFYNSVTPSSVSSVTGKFEYNTYGQSDRGVQLTELPSGTVTGSSGTSSNVNPLWMTSSWSDWGIGTSPSNNLIGLTRGDSNGSVRYYTQAQIDSAGVAYTKYQINGQSYSAPSGTYDNATSSTYAAKYGSFDPYCNLQPYFTCNSSAYMGMVYLNPNGNQASSHARSSNSLMYNYISSQDPGDNSGVQKHSIWASGGIALFGNQYSQTMYIVCYGRNVPTVQLMEQVIEDNPTSSGNYPLHYKVSPGNNKNSTGNYTVNFFEYNPNTQKSYALMLWDGSRRMLEFDVAAWEAKLAADDGTTGNSVQSLDTTISAGLITDISTQVPSFMLAAPVRLGGPIVRTAKSRWIVPLRSGSTYNIYETADFKTYTLYDTTANYTETLDNETIVLSDGTDTDKITSSFDSLDQAGLIEHQTSFNDYERTGLVISNNDRVIVRNHGSENVAFNVMGYEETS